MKHTCTVSGGGHLVQLDIQIIRTHLYEEKLHSIPMKGLEALIISILLSATYVHNQT